jgi:hypothetical protein
LIPQHLYYKAFRFVKSFYKRSLSTIGEHEIFPQRNVTICGWNFAKALSGQPTHVHNHWRNEIEAMEGDEIEENEIFFAIEENETERLTVNERNRRKQDLRYEKLRATAHDNLKVTFFQLRHSIIHWCIPLGPLCTD